MSITRILRVLATAILVISLVFIVAAEYRHNQKINSMIELSDATSSIATRLTTDRIAWRDQEGREHDYIIDPTLFDNLDYEWNLAGEKYVSRIKATYGENMDKTLGPYGFKKPEDKMASALTLPITIRRNQTYHPGKIDVIVWRD